MQGEQLGLRDGVTRVPGSGPALEERGEVDLPELEGERAVEHLVADRVCRLVHVDRAADEQVSWPADPRRHAIDGLVLRVEDQLVPGFHRRQERGEVVLDPGEIHLVEDQEIRQVGPLRRGKHQTQRRLGLVRGIGVQGVEVAQEPGRVAPVRRHGDHGAVMFDVEAQLLAVDLRVVTEESRLSGAREAREDDEALMRVAVPGEVQGAQIGVVEHEAGRRG